MLSGEKKYEFRKSIFKKSHPEKVLVYSTAPVKKLVGVFDIGEIIEKHPNVLWQELQEYSGVSNQDFFNYYRNTEKGFAIEIINFNELDKPIDPWSTIPNFTPPQSFSYIDPSIVQKFLC